MDIDDALNREEDEKVKGIIEPGSEIAGALVGTAIGFLVGGPPGAFAGAAAAPVAARTLRGLAAEFRERALGHREEVRVGAAIAFASDKIKEKLEDGEQPRQDDFFTDEEQNRSTAKEVFEGVVIAAQREAEEKKVRFYGNLLANLAFEQDIDRSQANYLIRLSEQLSYRQLCLLSLCAQNTLVYDEQNHFDLRTGSYRSRVRAGSPIATDMTVLLQEVYDLYQRGILENGGSAMIDKSDANPSVLSPEGVAVNLYNLMELWLVDPADLKPLIALLR